jgi:hypothetical protein
MSILLQKGLICPLFPPFPHLSSASLLAKFGRSPGVSRHARAPYSVLDLLLMPSDVGIRASTGDLLPGHTMPLGFSCRSGGQTQANGGEQRLPMGSSFRL